MRARPAILTLATVAVVLLLAACGSDDNKADRTVGSNATGRTVDVEMVDIAFRPTTLNVAKGEQVTFRFTNNGKIAHDAFIGDSDAQSDHEKDMRGGGMHHGDEPEALTLEPGKSGTLTHTFDDTGTVEVGCHQPGHYAAGMKITINVT